jgi:hypothetical protein
MNMVFAIAYFCLVISRDYENISCNSGDMYVLPDIKLG